MLIYDIAYTTLFVQTLEVTCADLWYMDINDVLDAQDRDLYCSNLAYDMKMLSLLDAWQW